MRAKEGSKRSTIKDVAAEADVSISTVSLVMNSKGAVNQETRDRVLATAQRLGYVPTQAARYLPTRRTGNIGFILREDHFTRSEPFYTGVFLGTEFEARHHNNYVLLTTIPKNYSPLEHTPRFLLERNIDGLIVAGKVDTAFLDEVSALQIPLLLVDYEKNPFPAVVIDNQNGARAAVNHLLSRGHKKIAFIGADLDHPSIKARFEGYRLALAGANLDYIPELVVSELETEPTFQTGLDLANRLLSGSQKPTAIFCANDAIALGVLEYARREGIAVPDHLAIVGFDDVPSAAISTPPLTTVRVFKEQLGELAMRYLIDLIQSQQSGYATYERSNHAVSVTTEVIVRASS